MSETSARTQDEEPEKATRRFYCVICARHTPCTNQDGHWTCEECGARVEEQ